MSRPIIEVRNLGKLYRLGQFNAGSLREEAERLFKRRPREEVAERDFWAVKDVSFDVQPGEVLGIVGRNGAGKSTLLKLLSRITEPTEGSIRIRGRVASLLEVGTGFHPELTGRENIYLNGAILGMSHAEIRSKFDEIVDFAEVEKFLDTPVKRYSSGMYVRLAFAVAAHLEPEILIVDEVLAVGDAAFQKKCLGKMKDVSGQGRTVLFVSHNMTAVASLCTSAVLMEGGHLTAIGSVRRITDQYNSLVTDGNGDRVRVWSEADAPGDSRVRLRKVEISKEGSDPSAIIGMNSPIKITLDYENLNSESDQVLEIVLRHSGGDILFHSFSNEDPNHSVSPVGGQVRTTCLVPPNILNEGYYTLDVHFIFGSMSNYVSAHAVATLSVIDTMSREGSFYLDKFLGPIHPCVSWNTETSFS